MAKRGFTPSAFALPGLSKDSNKPFEFSVVREDHGSRSIANVNRVNAKDNLEESSSLVDELGSLLPPQTEYTLENLTKTRPRSPRRRSPSPLARRKELENNSNFSFDVNSPQTSIKDHEAFSDERVNVLNEKPNLPSALILSNDVGLSISSRELSQSRSSPRLSDKPRTNRPKVAPKPERNKNYENGELLTERTDLNVVSVVDDPKIRLVDEDHHRGDNDPPPLPTSPPPLEDDEILGSLAYDTLNVETKRSFPISGFEKTQSIDRTTGKLSAKLVDNPLKNEIEDNVLNNSKQLRSDTTSSNNSPSSRIAKWQGYGRTSSEDNYILPKIGAGFPNRQTPLDSAIASRLSKYETPYSSRQRKPVEKTLSANRRRFKPVTLTDEDETTNSENIKENIDSLVNAEKKTNQPMSVGLHGMKTEKNVTNSLPRNFRDGISATSQPLSSSGSNRQYNFQGNSFVQGEKAKLDLDGLEKQSVTDKNTYDENSSQKSWSSDSYGASRTAHQEPDVVVEYDSGNDGLEKFDDSSGKGTVTSVGSKIRTSNVNDPNEFKIESNINENEVSRSANNDRNRTEKEHGSSGMTLPKVVIEYDGEVVNEPSIDGYDSEETSDEGKNLVSSSFSQLEDLDDLHYSDNMSDGSVSLYADEDDIGILDYTDDDDELDVTLRDEDLTFDNPVREEAEETRVLRGSELDDDGLMDPPLQIMTETSESEGSDEILFEPPPMFASSDEAEVKEEVEDSDVFENGYEGNLPSPVIPSSLLEVQPQEDKRFHNLALEVWTEDDCVDWLDFIGLGHFATEFREHHVDGRVLKNINFQLLEEIGINSPDEREVILSEIYRRFHPEEEDMFEMEIQGALQSASEKEKMKIMAVLNALRSPAFQAELGLDTSTGSSSPHGSEAGFYMGAETGSISSGVTTGSEDHSQDINMPPPPPPPSWSQTAKKTKSLGRELDDYEIIPRGGKLKKPGKTSKDKDKSGEKSSKSEKHGRKEKKHKRVTRLLDSLSLSTSSSKLTKLFHHSSSSSSSATKKLNPTMQYLLQAGPQGLIRIWPTALSEEMNYCSFMVNMTTTSAEIIKLVFEKYELVDDPRRYYVCEMGLGKGGSRHDLTDADCPLLRQCRWTDPDKQRFELRCRDEGVIKMLFELEGYEDDLDYRSIPLSAKTPCTEAVELIVKKFQLPGKANEYYLVEVSEECEDDREEVADHVCPLRLQMAWSAPDHVFRLCRRPTDSSTDVNDDNKDTVDGWMTDATEDASQEPGITSEVSSVRGEDELEFAPVPGSVEGNEIKEEISEDLMEGLNELDQVIDEESEVIASQELEAVRHELAAKEEELKELRLRSDTLNEREDELISLRRENEELKMRSVARGKLSEKDESLVEKDRALEELRQENEELRRRIDDLEEKLKNETAMRDREIERLYARNNELSSNEKELENLRQLRDTCDSQEKELEKLRLMNQESSSGQNELASRLAELKQKHNELLMEVNEMEKLKQVNRELTRKVDEGDMFRQELEKSQVQKKELVEKLKELERERRESKKGENDRVENLRQKNLEVAAKSKDAEEMRTNIIKLTAQMREMEKQSQERANKLQKELEDAASEKQQLLDRIAELEESERHQAQKKDAENNAKEVEDLKLENIFLVERTKEVDELKSAVAKLAAEAKENESFKQKYKELRDVETYLTKQVSTAETIARQKDKKLKESENKINTLTEAVKDMEAKLEEHEQNKLYLDQLLAMLKDRDPTLLHVINTSLASSEQEEWC